ncbi:TIGR04500 family putative peptide maturation system protein [Rhizohabitans arisaemae]|uniref:TIGR04500 family putative peptide maturation system protein n=1 Tax=Rhizohabitans arisaemae TaxID=2720610 RepID=UPI0024B13255|nr:TIGR04500 family putative peptide maturation system protein [Rhizohabitans arisaemae]
MTGYPETLAAAVDLLRGLPRDRTGVPDAKRAVAAWRAAHPESRAQLVPDIRPGTTTVDYDLLVDHPDGGTVAITASVEDGVPWTIDHSTHWAASKVLSVDDEEISVQTALLTLRAHAERDRTVHDDLIDHCIFQLETAGEPEPSPEELQRASDDYRRRRGLYSRAAMSRWLEEVNLTPEAYQNHLYSVARANRFRDRVERESARTYFDDHIREFDQVSAVWVLGPESGLAELAGQDDPFSAVAAAVADLSGELTVQVADRMAAELPEPLRNAAEGSAVGPVPYRDTFLFGAVRRRRPARPDAVALAAAGRAAFTAYLADRRAKARIRWFWL